MLRPLRLLRLLAFARILNRSAAGLLVDRVSAYVAGIAVMALGLGALAGLDAEQGASEANITTAGRLVAVALMLVGIASIGAVTAGVAAWLMAQVAEEARADASSANDG